MADMTKRNPDVHLAGKTLAETRHACAFFNSREEQYRILLPFIKEAVDQGEKSIFLIDPEYQPEHLHRLKHSGIDADALCQRDQIEIRPWEEAYLRGGRFSQDAMLSLIDELYATSNANGFSQARLWANMEWALQDRPGVTDLVEYEARLNYILPKYDHITVCVYDLAKFNASVIMDVVRTHPLVIIGENLQENPFYVPPDEFLRELGSRLPQAARND